DELPDQLRTLDRRLAAHIPDHLLRIYVQFAAKLRLKLDDFRLQAAKPAVKSGVKTRRPAANNGHIEQFLGFHVKFTPSGIFLLTSATFQLIICIVLKMRIIINTFDKKV